MTPIPARVYMCICMYVSTYVCIVVYHECMYARQLVGLLKVGGAGAPGLSVHAFAIDASMILINDCYYHDYYYYTNSNSITITANNNNNNIDNDNTNAKQQ